MMQTRVAVARWIAFSVLLLLSVTLQTMVFPRISAVPNPMVSVVAAVSLAMFSGVWGGMAAGAVSGMLCDALLPHIEAYYTLTTMAAGALTGFLCGKIMQRNFWSALLLCTASVCVIEMFYVLFFHVATGRAPWSAMGFVGVPEILASIVCIPVIYPAFRGVAKIFAGD
ncbi:MAG: rod shape-determining protein MreD [Oscillospiraceae bacterium]|jgi:rod shape-determining protein MreD|nr:rod shape-determining protein MreD [Oscillospiraceae bacterium]